MIQACALAKLLLIALGTVAIAFLAGISFLAIYFRIEKRFLGKKK